ncbi:hypothetical protein COO60DRAFT_284832 [Scenedesmus sp. NREL 46B-D3]|nr:hypothetical protein COO60DRAFT_284832 [Scenedesmus sp. NREL 46B-D3]
MPTITRYARHQKLALTSFCFVNTVHASPTAPARNEPATCNKALSVGPAIQHAVSQQTCLTHLLQRTLYAGDGTKQFSQTRPPTATFGFVVCYRAITIC